MLRASRCTTADSMTRRASNTSRVSAADGFAITAPRFGRSSTSRLWPRRASAARTAPRLTPRSSERSRSTSLVPGARRWSRMAFSTALKTRSSAARPLRGIMAASSPSIAGNVNKPSSILLTIDEPPAYPRRRMKPTLDFLLNGERVSLADENPARTLLTWLRESWHLIGTKEGCAEGDCGACTVVLADVDAAGRLRYQPVNACILFLGALEGKEVITVEGLKSGRSLHPVQRAMVDCHGSQCGFCTPGFVMALYAHYKSATPPDLCDAIAGNLCRCTGYRAILEAGN